MESAQAVAAKRRVLIDALMMCLSRSRVVEVVDAKTVHSVIDSASAELWRQGEFRLDPVWKILVAQPGLSAEDVAPPLLVFKAYEGELGVVVRLPQALSAIPRGEQVRLRDKLGILRDDFAKAIDEMKALATTESTEQNRKQIMRDAEASFDREDSRSAPRKKAPSKQSKMIALGLSLVALGALGTSIWFALRDTAASYNLSDVAGTLQLSNGRGAGSSLTATITDPKWESLSKAEREKAASAIMDVEAGKGIKSMVLLDTNGATKAMVNETQNGRSILVP